MEETLSRNNMVSENVNMGVSFLVDQAAKEYVPNALQSFEHYRKQLELKIRKNFIDEFHTLRDGYMLIGNYNQQLKNRLDILPEVQSMLRNPVQVRAALSEGKTFQDILKWSDDELVEIYALADRLLNDKHYYESSVIFKLLCLVQPLSYFFWMGVGDALEADNKNKEAIMTYYGGLFANPYSFDLYLKLCKTLCKIGEPEKAVALLEEAFKVIDETEKEGPLTPELIALRQELKKVQEILIG